MHDIMKKYKMIILDMLNNLYEEPIALIGHDGFCEGHGGTEASLSLRKKERWSRDVPTRHKYEKENFYSCFCFNFIVLFSWLYIRF